MEQFDSTLSSLIDSTLGFRYRSVRFMAPFLAMAELKRALFCSFGLTKTFRFTAPFLAMAELKRALFCSSGLTKTFHFMAPFLAMAELKRALFCSSGLTKTLDFILRFHPSFFASFPHRWFLLFSSHVPPILSHRCPPDSGI